MCGKGERGGGGYGFVSCEEGAGVVYCEALVG